MIIDVFTISAGVAIVVLIGTVITLMNCCNNGS